MVEKPPKPKLVKLHDGRPPLSDIPGRLRLLADDIESGRLGDIATAFVVLPRQCDYPTILGYGNVDGDNHPVLQFELAKQQFVSILMKRS